MIHGLFGWKINGYCDICGRFFMLGNQPYNVYSMGIIHPIIRGIIPQNVDF